MACCHVRGTRGGFGKQHRIGYDFVGKLQGGTDDTRRLVGWFYEGRSAWVRLYDCLTSAWCVQVCSKCSSGCNRSISEFSKKGGIEFRPAYSRGGGDGERDYVRES